MELTSFPLEEIEHGEDLPVVWHEGFSDELATLDQLLQFLESPAHDVMVLGSKGLLDWQNQLGQHWENLAGVLSGIEELVTATIGEEEVGLCALSETLEEDGKIEMVIQELKFLDLPSDLVESYFWQLLRRLPFLWHLRNRRRWEDRLARNAS